MSQFKHKPVQPDTKSKVQQHFKDQADAGQRIRKHMATSGRFGQPIGDPNATRQPRFLDLSSSDSYHDMLNRVTQINSMFGALPARIRTQFQNRPEVLMKFCENPANTATAVKLGLIDDPEVIQAVLSLEAAADKEAKEAGEKPASKADPEAQPPYTPSRGTNPPEGG